TSSTRWPRRASPRPRASVVVVLPTPPFWFAIAHTRIGWILLQGVALAGPLAPPEAVAGAPCTDIGVEACGLTVVFDAVASSGLASTVSTARRWRSRRSGVRLCARGRDSP